MQVKTGLSPPSFSLRGRTTRGIVDLKVGQHIGSLTEVTVRPLTHRSNYQQAALRMKRGGGPSRVPRDTDYRQGNFA